jgi:hypothetical protein
VGAPGSVADQDEQDVVVLMECAGGGELKVVYDTLTGPLNTHAVFITRADLGTTSLTFDPGTGLLDVGGRQVRPAVVWVRHASSSAILAQARPGGSMKPLAATAWSTFVDQLAGPGMVTLPGHAPTGPGQLLDAERLGIKAPRTVLTTDVVSGARRMRTQRVIVKIPDFRLYDPDHQNWLSYLPVIADRDTVLADPAAGEHPILIQEYVNHARELRIFYLDGALCAFDVHKASPASMWTDPSSVDVTEVSCPPAAADAVRALSVAWRLHYGAFDILISESGEPTFLEVNPDGDWLWYEHKARSGTVSFMASVMVRALFLSSSAGGVSAGDCDAE